MTRTLAIFGAGPGIGLATARRFGRAGFQVALVARNAERIGAFADQLAAEDITALPFAADLHDRGGHAALVAEIEGKLGDIEVAVINAYLSGSLIRPILQVDTDNLRSAIDGGLLAPHSLATAVLPGMVRRGAGGLLFGLGASATQPVPVLGGYGPAEAALRNYMLAAHNELADSGIYVGALVIGGMIEHSDAAASWDADPELSALTATRIAPDDLAEHYWALYRDRDRAELPVPS